MLCCRMTEVQKMNVAYNMDCMEAMKQFPDNAFDLAVVDPGFGDVNPGGDVS